MDSKDTSPFGYNFQTTDFLPNDPFTNGNSVLNENESQYVADFFNHTNPYSNSLAQPLDTKNSLDGFDWNFAPPPTIHGVSTTISDQSQLQHSFHNDHNYGSDPMLAAQFPTSHDDLQAASTLFNQAHASPAPPQPNHRSYSFHDVPATHNLPTTHAPTAPPSTSGYPVPEQVMTAHGPMNEQLSAVLPNHSTNGSIDASIAAQFAQVSTLRHHQIVQLGQPHRPQLKRHYTYGTDNAFNASGFQVTSPHDTEEAVTQRLLHDMTSAQLAMDEAAAQNNKVSTSSPTKKASLSTGLVRLDIGEEGQSGEENSGGEEPAKKRRKESHVSTTLEKTSRKSISDSAKTRKASADGGSKKKRQASDKKAQRENLTEEQKRSNHILSEQKRRNLIKRGFEDLHELVPELRSGGLSKSTVLLETVMFLEKLLNDNQQYVQMIESSGG